MAINKKNEYIYKNRIIAALIQHGKLPKSRLAYYTKMNQYTIEPILYELVEEKIVKEIEGSVIIYELGDYKTIMEEEKE